MYESPSWLHELWVARDTLWAGFQASVYVSASSGCARRFACTSI